MAAAACERAKSGNWLGRHKRSASEPAGDDPSDVTPSAASESGSTPSFTPTRSISQELVRERDQSLTGRWTDSLRKSRDRLRKRFSLKDERRPASEPAAERAAEEDYERPPPEGADGGERQSRRDVSRRADSFLQPVRRFGKVASRSVVGKPVVRFAKTCRRDVPKPYRFIRDKLRSRSNDPERLRSYSPHPRSLSPSNGGSNNEDEIVFAFGAAKEQDDEHIYDPVGEPPDVDQTIRDADDDDDEDDAASPVVEEPDDDFSRFSRFSKPQFEAEPPRKPESSRAEPLEPLEQERQSVTPTPCLKDTSDSGRNSRPSSRTSRNEDFPKSVRFGKKRVSDGSDSVGVRFKPLSTSSSQDEDVGSHHGLQRVRVQLKDDVSGLNIVSKLVQPQPDVVALPPIEIQQLEEPPRVLRPRQNQVAPESPPQVESPPVVAEETPPPEPPRGKRPRNLPSWAAPSKPTPSVVPNEPPPPPVAAVAGPGVPPASAAAAYEPPAPAAAAYEPPAAYEEPSPPESIASEPPSPEPIVSEPSPPEITLTTDCRPPRPPPPAPETLERRRRPLQAIDNIQRSVEPQPDEPPPPPREPYQPKIREFAESRRALTLKPPRKKKRSDANDPRSQSADQADRADKRTIAIFGTVTRPARSKRRGAGAVAAAPPLSREPPPRPPPPAPRRPPRGRSGSRGRVAVSLNDVRYADESATEESADYGDGRSYRRLLDDADRCPYRPTRSLTRPARRSLPQGTVTGRLLVGGGQVRVENEEEAPPARPSRGSRVQLEPRSFSRGGHNDTFDSIGDGPDAAHEPTQRAPGSVTSEGPRSLHSYQQEEFGSGDELMLIVHDGEPRRHGDDRKETELCVLSRHEETKENRPEGDRDCSPEVELRKLTPGRPEYAHVRKRSSLLLREQEANYDYPPPVPKKLNDLRAPSPSAPPRRRQASLSPGRAGLDGCTTWPKRRHTTAPAAPDAPDAADSTEAPVAPPPRTVRRSKVRSSTVPRGYKTSRGARPTLYHLAKEQRSQDDGVDMKNRPLPPPPPPPRYSKKSAVYSNPAGYSNPDFENDKNECITSPETPVPMQTQTQESAPPPAATETLMRESPPPRPATPPPRSLFMEEGSVSPADSEPDLSSQATDAPSEITLRSEGSQATLTSGRDPGCESTDDEFFSMASEVDGRRRTPASPQERRREAGSAAGAARPQEEQQQQQQQQQQAGLVEAAPRHVLVPHFIQRVSTSEMDAASANILELTAGRIKVTELEVDRIYIREGRVKLICHEEGSDDEGAGGGPPRAGPPPKPPKPRLLPAGSPPGGASGADGSGGGRPPPGVGGAEPRTAAAAAGEPSSSSDSSESRPLDPGLLRELDAVESQLRQIGTCLQDIQRGGGRGRSEPVPTAPPAAGRDYIPCRAGDSSETVAAKRKSAECEDASPPRSPAAAGPSVHARLEGIKTALEQVITPERQALTAAAAQSATASAGSDTDSAAAAAAPPQRAADNDSECIYGIPAEVADRPGHRVRLSQLFSSFGKGLRRKSGSRKPRRVHSQFYVDIDRSDSDSSGLDLQLRHRSDPSLCSSSSGSGSHSSSDTVVMGGGASQPERRLITVNKQPSTGGLQYARVIQEFSSNLQTLCKQVSNSSTSGGGGGGGDGGSAADASDEAPDPDPASEPPPPPAGDLSDSDSESETLHTACDQPPPAPDASRSFLVAQELMTSEETFVDALRLLNVEFRAAAQEVPPDAKPAGIPPADLEAILSHLPELQRLNEELLADLRARIANWSRQPRIADVIVRKGPFLKLYSAYICDFQQQKHMLDDCRSRYPGFDLAVTKFEASPRCRKLSVAHYMLKPVQRLPQYRLLLSDYLGRLEVGAEDYDNTRAALEVVCEVAEHANKSMKEGDNFRKLLQLQERLRWTEIVKPGRGFLREGELLKLCRKGPQPRFVILLTDSLLLTRYSGSATSAAGPLNLDYVIPLTGMRISVPVGATDEYQNEFSVVSTTRSFSLTASSNKERDDWMNALTGAIEKNAQNRSTFSFTPTSDVQDGDCVQDGYKLGDKAPVWVPDNRASMCQLCTTEFTVTNRRHHCRACGKVVCGPCSMEKAPLLYRDNNLARVCDVCLGVLQKDVDDSDVDPQSAGQSKKPGLGTAGRKSQRRVPKRLEVSANVSGCQMSGYLQRRTRQKWKRFWFVLRDSVLYMYRASQDVVAMDGLPVLGYQVQPITNSKVRSYEGVDSELVFQLTHPNQPPLVFHADNSSQAEKWISNLRGATVLT